MARVVLVTISTARGMDATSTTTANESESCASGRVGTL